MRVLSLSLAVALSATTPAVAIDRSFQTAVENSLRGSVPGDWFLRASWRDDTLVVFVSPPPPKSFEIWYDAQGQKAMMERLCKTVPKAIWEQIGAAKDIAMEQVVGGNGGKGSWRLSCRDYLAEARQTD